MASKRPWKVCSSDGLLLMSVLASCATEEAAWRALDRNRAQFDKIAALRSIKMVVLGPDGRVVTR